MGFLTQVQQQIRAAFGRVPAGLNLVFVGYQVLISTTTWCNIIPKFQIIFEMSSFEFFVGLVIYKGNLLNPIDWEFDQKTETYSFFESNTLERKTKFFQNKKNIAAGDQPT